MRTEKSFTIIELLVVIAIIGLLSSIVLVSTQGAKERARIGKGMALSGNIHRALGAFAVANYDFNNGTAEDLSGNGNNGTIYGAVTTVNIPELGNALQFDGINDYVGMNIPSIQPTFNSKGTMEAWFRITDINNPAGRQLLARIGSGDALMLYTERYDGNTKRGLKHTWYNGADWGDIAAKGDLQSGKLYYAVYTWNETTQILYLDGAEINRRNKPAGTLILSQAESRIGGTGYYFGGLIDEVRIYNQDLALSEIQEHYVEGLKKYQDLVLK